ncbi:MULTISPECIES: DUF4234 domain-containing protein [unclassified Pseudomonas]|uniref:DUF4234 domain-containing protein n=1 Tax=unclassified Pseudomonas TaxID=196821 RepID=UPI002AC93FD7|nr:MULTISPECIES: DUF4234 domain-containing protein [unclassified Pseudomonas]MEB0044996.1 DUF4234 domain-containing protein [Pseudomonas sp. Dout3]MEB0095992.1 DUF4234 domain-containing protein [Pseudomonas sp. DC1.2]WPX57856.1 DUF4234 domain-containing protein [Pseudomonas sp. DC1.2]
MFDISSLKDKNNLTTLNLFLLVILTAGLYLIVWMYRTGTAIEEVTKIKIVSSSFFISYLALMGIGGLLVDLGTQDIVMLGSIMLLTSTILGLVWCFRARDALREYTQNEHDFELLMNWVCTLFFSFYYVNYCINDLPEAKQNSQGAIKPVDTSIEK